MGHRQAVQRTDALCEDDTDFHRVRTCRQAQQPETDEGRQAVQQADRSSVCSLLRPGAALSAALVLPQPPFTEGAHERPRRPSCPLIQVDRGTHNGGMNDRCALGSVANDGARRQGAVPGWPVVVRCAIAARSRRPASTKTSDAPGSNVFRLFSASDLFDAPVSNNSPTPHRLPSGKNSVGRRPVPKVFASNVFGARVPPVSANAVTTSCAVSSSRQVATIGHSRRPGQPRCSAWLGGLLD